MRLPLHLLVALLAVDVVAFAVLAGSVSHGGGSLPTVAGAGLLALGAMAALAERTWGIGLVLATASSFAAAAALHLAPGGAYLVALVGAVPFLLTVKPMARFHLGATVLFATLAAAAGTAAPLAYALVR